MRFAHFNTSEGYATGHPEVATSAGYALFCSVDNTSLAQLGTVLCRSMGFSSVTSSQTSSIEGIEDAELKWVTRANCTGSERNIKGCSLEVGSTCPSRLAVSVQCSGASEAVPSLGEHGLMSRSAAICFRKGSGLRVLVQDYRAAYMAATCAW